MIDKELTLKQAWKDGKWIQQMVKENNMSPMWVKLLPEIIICLDDIYPGEWDFNIHCMYDMTTRVKTNMFGHKYVCMENKIFDIQFKPVIRFKEVPITNERGQNHLIRDLYVEMGLNMIGNDLQMTTLSGTRATITEEEWRENYFHSHLSWAKDPMTDNNGQIADPYEYYDNRWKDFCLGAGHIRDMMVDLNSDFDCDLFQMILLHLRDMMGWESIEGTPYRYIERLTTLDQDARIKPLIYFTEEQMSRYYDMWIQRLRATKQKPMYTILNPAIFNLFDEKEINIDTLVQKTDRMCYFMPGVELTPEDYLLNTGINPICISQNGHRKTLCSEGESMKPDTSNFTNMLVFQGEEVKFKILETKDSKKQEEKNYIFYINPNLENYVNNRIKEEVSFLVYRNSAVKAHRRYSHAGAVPAEGKVPVQHDTQGGVVGDTALQTGWVNYQAGDVQYTAV